MKLITATAIGIALFAAGNFEVQAAEGKSIVMANSTEAKPKPKKICKTDTRATGTRLSRPVCKTQEEWDTKEDGQEIGLRSQTSRADMENVGGMNQP